MRTKSVEIKATPAVGTIGFYRPDPGGPMSPMRMLGETGGQYKIFQINQELLLTLDKDEWMTLQEMWESTRAMLLGTHDDSTLPMLRDRIHSLVCAQQHIDKRLTALRAYDDRLNAQGKAPDGDDYNALYQLIFG